MNKPDFFVEADKDGVWWIIGPNDEVHPVPFESKELAIHAGTTIVWGKDVLDESAAN